MARIRRFAEKSRLEKIEEEFERLGKEMEDGGPSRRNIDIYAFRPGIGKTTFVARKIVELEKSGKLERGAIIMFSRHNEIDQFIGVMEKAGIDPKAYAVLSDERYDLKGAGKENAWAAPILLTTQQKLVSRMGDGRFEHCSFFFYRGKARYLRIWDESIERAPGITVRRDDLIALPSALRSTASSFVKFVEELVERLDKARADDVASIDPAFARMAAYVASTASAGLTSRDLETVEKLAALGGSSVLLSSDSYCKWSISGVGRPLPFDLGPLIVLDGSGSVRYAYDVWAASGGHIRRAAELAVRYQNLRFHWWKKATGRTALADKARLAEIVANAADLLNEDPSEPWLVIGFKSNWKADLADKLRAKLTNKTQFEYLQWGDHHGVNSYTHIKKVLVVGPLRYSDADYRSKYLAAKGGTVAPIPEDELKKLELGEVRHNLLQAICRANVRNQKALCCGECDVYLVMSNKDDLEAQLRETFPMCVIEPWVPVPPRVRGRPAVVMKCLSTFFADTKNVRLTKDELRTIMGLARKQDLTKALKSPYIKPFLIDLGIEMKRTWFERIKADV